MKLLVPMVPKASTGPLRVIAIIKSAVKPTRRRGNAVQFGELLARVFSDYEQSAVQVRSYLDLFHDGPIQINMICNTGLADGNEPGLDQAMDLIAGGQVDLVI